MADVFSVKDQKHPLINSLWPSDSKWHWRSYSTLVQVIACCMTAPETFTWDQFHRALPSYYSMKLVWNVCFKIAAIFFFLNPKSRWVKDQWSEVKPSMSNGRDVMMLMNAIRNPDNHQRPVRDQHHTLADPTGHKSHSSYLGTHNNSSLGSRVGTS